jgi:HSP90 family molecular chaperone
LTEPVDEYCIQAMPEFDGKKFQNVAKEGLKLDDGEKSKEHFEQLQTAFEPLTNWLKDKALKDKVKKEIIFLNEFLNLRSRKQLSLKDLPNRHLLSLHRPMDGRVTWNAL